MSDAATEARQKAMQLAQEAKETADNARTALLDTLKSVWDERQEAIAKVAELKADMVDLMPAFENISAQAIADHLGTSTNTINSYRNPPKQGGKGKVSKASKTKTEGDAEAPASPSTAAPKS